MKPLFLASLTIEMASLYRWAAQRGLADDEGRALHHLLSETFGKGILQPFRLMVTPGAISATLYAYSSTSGPQLRETARDCAMPDALVVCAINRLAVKAMPDVWREGRRLSFDVRVRPVRRLLKPAGHFAKGAEIDAFLIEQLRQNQDKQSPSHSIIAREDIYRRWLAERLEGAAKLESAQLVRFERSAVMRGRKAQGPDAVFHGELTVLDSANFATRLLKGVGRHTAYGYGMLLLRPPR